MFRNISLLQNFSTVPSVRLENRHRASTLVDHRLKFTFTRRHQTLFNMGIKGFYGYCLKKVKECHRTVNIMEEIAKYRR